MFPAPAACVRRIINDHDYEPFYYHLAAVAAAAAEAAAAVVEVTAKKTSHCFHFIFASFAFLLFMLLFWGPVRAGAAFS